MSQQLILIKTLEELKQLKDYLKDKEYISYDTETNGTDKASKIIGLSVCAEENIGYYVVLSYWDNLSQTLIELETLKEIKDLITTLSTKQLIMHNAPFDCSMTLNNFGVDLMPAVHTDTLLLGHILNENRRNGLKELGVSLFGDDAKKEQLEMKESVHANGGLLTKDKYELYKADSDLIGKYGAKDAILTLKIFGALVPQLYEEKLDQFFYDEESMPLLKGPTYQLNTAGLRIDLNKLVELKGTLESECMEAKAFIHKEIKLYVEDKYKGTTDKNTFNIGASKQLAWLLFIKLDNQFHTLTEAGRELCKSLEIRIPYGPADKIRFIRTIDEMKGRVYEDAKYNYKTGKMGRPKKVGDVWNYLACGKESLAQYKDKYKWVQKLLEYAKNLKLLNTYVVGIQNRAQYSIIRPSFLQHGTTSGRYSSKNPNFQNLPRNDKRIKSCVVSRPGKVFVGADYSQLEPRVFASFSGDKRLLKCFEDKDDFYSVIGVEVFDKRDCSLKKDDVDSFANKYPKLREIAKTIALSATYGTTAFKMAPVIGMPAKEAQQVIDNYFNKFPSVYKLMLESHLSAKKEGQVVNLFGRPRRIPEAKNIEKIYGLSEHGELPYEIRNLLNLSVNHRIQSTGASIVNRASIAFYNKIRNSQIANCNIVMQIHDEIVVECEEKDSLLVASILQDAMENTVVLPGVKLEAVPKIGKSLAELK